jgi:hypothetical protein
VAEAEHAQAVRRAIWIWLEPGSLHTFPAAAGWSSTQITELEITQDID